MTQLPLPLAPTPPDRHTFAGATYDAKRDGPRLHRGLRLVLQALESGGEWTLRELADYAGCGEASASARFRDLRRLGYPVRKKCMGGGKWVYWMDRP